MSSVIPLAKLFPFIFLYINRVKHILPSGDTINTTVFFRRVQALYMLYWPDTRLMSSCEYAFSGERTASIISSEQGTDDAETGKVQCPVHRVNVNPSGDICTVLVGIGWYLGYMVDEAFQNSPFRIFSSLSTRLARIRR